MEKKKQRLLKLVPLEILLAATVFLAALFAFSFIVHEAVLEKEDVFDNRVIQFFSAYTSPGLISLMEKITFFGSSTFLFPAYIIVIAYCIYKNKQQYAADIAVIAITSTAMMFALKQFFHRHRPPLPIIKGIAGYSFPSGHSLSSFIFCMILIYLTWKGAIPLIWKLVVIVLLFFCPLAIGLSRIILEVHYATDVIGGFCLAIVWVILSFFLFKKIRRNKLSPTAGTGS